MTNKYKTKKQKGVTKYEHRFVMEQHISRELTPNEIVHHKDGNKHNNKIENLEIMTRGEHIKIHLGGSKKSTDHKNRIALGIKKWHSNMTKKEKDNLMKKISTGMKGKIPWNKGMRGICKIQNCDKPHSAKGYCKKHYEIQRLINIKAELIK